jgi:hypothetical protein
MAVFFQKGTSRAGFFELFEREEAKKPLAREGQGRGEWSFGELLFGY